MTVAFLLSFFLALQALLLSFFIASRRFFVACLVASHFSLHCVVIFTAYLVAIILIRTKSQPLNKAEIKVLSIYVYNHLSNVSFVPYFVSQCTYAHYYLVVLSTFIRKTFCRQYCLLFVFTLHLIPILTIFAV